MKSRTLSLGPTACPGVSAGLGTEGGEGWGGGGGYRGVCGVLEGHGQVGVCVCVCVRDWELDGCSAGINMIRDTNAESHRTYRYETNDTHTPSDSPPSLPIITPTEEKMNHEWTLALATLPLCFKQLSIHSDYNDKRCTPGEHAAARGLSM